MADAVDKSTVEVEDYLITRIRAMHYEQSRYVVDIPTGICENCGNPINPNRLKIIPNAKYCVDCQRKIEEGGC